LETVLLVKTDFYHTNQQLTTFCLAVLLFSYFFNFKNKNKREGTPITGKHPRHQDSKTKLALF
jgi:hypothetical protein